MNTDTDAIFALYDDVGDITKMLNTALNKISTHGKKLCFFSISNVILK